MTRTKLSGDIMDNYVQSTRAKDVGGGERLLQAASLPLHPQEQVSNTILIRVSLISLIITMIKIRMNMSTLMCVNVIVVIILLSVRVRVGEDEDEYIQTYKVREAGVFDQYFTKLTK